MHSAPTRTPARIGLQRRLCALGAGLRAALRALRTGSPLTKR